MKRMKKIFACMLAVIMIFAGMFSNEVLTSVKANEGTELSVQLSDLKTISLNPDGNLYQERGFDIEFNWDASAHGTNIKTGDYFTVTLPTQFDTTGGALTTDSVDLKTTDGTIVGTFTIDRTNGTAKAVFNSNVEGKYDVKGTLNLRGRIYNNTETANTLNTFTVSSGDSNASTNVMVYGPYTTNQDHIFLWTRSGFMNYSGRGYTYDPEKGVDRVRWGIYINNMNGTTYDNVKIQDSLSKPDGTETDEQYIEGTFYLRTVADFTSDTKFTGASALVDINDFVILSTDKKSFTLNLPQEYWNKKVLIEYETTFNYVTGNAVKNNVYFISDTRKENKTTTRRLAGQSDVDAAAGNTLKITTVDAEDNTILLEGAVFEMTRPNGDTFTLITGEDGTVTSAVLQQGTYTVREITAPFGYELDANDKVVTIGSVEYELVVENAPITTNISVNKIWDDEDNKDELRPDEITVRVFDGEDEIAVEVIEEDEKGNWSVVFEDLRKYRGNEEIEYTIVEDSVEGYETEISDLEDGVVTITNTHTVEKPKTPDTSDSTNTGAWTGLFGSVMVIAGAVWLLIRDKRRKA